MEKHCPNCGTELNTDANFCQYCGVEIVASPKLKNDVLKRQSQIRFLTVLAFSLIALVLGVYLFRNAQAADMAQSSNLAEITGDWVGHIYYNERPVLNYTVHITHNGSEIRGTAITAELDDSGSADAQIIGTYSDGNLNFQEYGGGESGEWEGDEMCFWELDLTLEQVDGEAVLSGTFEAIDCNDAGTVMLTRPE